MLANIQSYNFGDTQKLWDCESIAEVMHEFACLKAMLLTKRNLDGKVDAQVIRYGKVEV